MTSCPSCGAGNVEGTRFCVKCGTTLPTAPALETWRQSGDLGQQQQPSQGAPSGGFAPGSQPSGYQTPDPYAPAAPSGWPQQPPQAMQQSYGGGPGLFSIGEKREPMMVVLYIFLTCGIYSWFWLYTTITEIKN